MENKNKKVITRFAPSPTGFLHIGGVRTAIFAYLWARKNNGTFILRIEDTDKKREVAGSIDHIIKSLKWIGIDWDYGPDKENPFGSVLQSQRLETYREWAEKLIEKGFAYTDPYTEEEVESFRKKAELDKKPFLYRDYRPKETTKWELGKTLRFKVKEIKRYNWTDAVRGQLSAGEEALDDFVLIKADGYPTYNFAHIIDDLNMGVTHIFRSDEFISSTPRFLSLYEALEIEPPVFATLPPILGTSRKKKLSKRDGAKDVLDYKEDGILPEALFNFLTFIGFNPGGEKEIYTKDELVEVFDLSKIQISGGVFNEEKLLWMNKEHIKKLDRKTQFKFVLDNIPDVIKNSDLFSEERLEKMLDLIIDRIEKWSDIKTLFDEGEISYFFQKPEFDQKLLVWKEGDLETSKKHLAFVKNILENTDDSFFQTPEQIKTVLWDYAEKEGRGNVLWPLRVALTGKEKSPDPFTMLSILGKKESLSRLTLLV
jgi:glutamyl-tRNA synthetase